MKHKKLIHHKHVHTMALCIILGFSVIMFSLLQGKPDMQFMVGFIAALSYVMWGIIYHVIEHDLYPKVVVEYVLIAAIGLALLYTVLFI
jgi:multisubunit Na+/H+ antiporter MnhB subunit